MMHKNNNNMAELCLFRGTQREILRKRPKNNNKAPNLTYWEVS